MENNYIVLDSTGVFCVQHLLSEINNPDKDRLIIIGQAYNESWIKREMLEFALVADKYLSGLPPATEEDVINSKNKVFNLLEREMEKVNELIHKLVKLNLAKIVTPNNFFLPLENYNVSDHDLIKYRNENFSFGIEERSLPIIKDRSLDDKSRSSLKEYYFADVLRKFRLKALQLSEEEKKKLKLTISDIDAVAYAISNEIPYKSYNPNVEDGSLAKAMGYVNRELITSYEELPSDFELDDLDDYLSDKKCYLKKMKNVARLTSKILISGTKAAIQHIPGLDVILEGTNVIKDLAEIVQNHDRNEGIAVIKSTKLQKPTAKVQAILSCYNYYRMHPIQRKREL